MNILNVLTSDVTTYFLKQLDKKTISNLIIFKITKHETKFQKELTTLNIVLNKDSIPEDIKSYIRNYPQLDKEMIAILNEAIIYFTAKDLDQSIDITRKSLNISY